MGSKQDTETKEPKGIREKREEEGKQRGARGESNEPRKRSMAPGMGWLEVVRKTARTWARSYSSPKLSLVGSPVGSEVL